MCILSPLFIGFYITLLICFYMFYVQIVCTIMSVCAVGLDIALLIHTDVWFWSTFRVTHWYVCIGSLNKQKGADVDACDVKGWTALFHATFSGHHNMVQILLKNRANIDAVWVLAYCIISDTTWLVQLNNLIFISIDQCFFISSTVIFCLWRRCYRGLLGC